MIIIIMIIFDSLWFTQPYIQDFILHHGLQVLKMCNSHSTSDLMLKIIHQGISLE